MKMKIGVCLCSQSKLSVNLILRYIFSLSELRFALVYTLVKMCMKWHFLLHKLTKIYESNWCAWSFFFIVTKFWEWCLVSRNYLLILAAHEYTPVAAVLRLHSMWVLMRFVMDSIAVVKYTHGTVELLKKNERILNWRTREFSFIYVEK